MRVLVSPGGLAGSLLLLPGAGSLHLHSGRVSPNGHVDLQTVDAQADMVVAADLRRRRPSGGWDVSLRRDRGGGPPAPPAARPRAPHRYAAFAVKALCIAAAALALFCLYRRSHERIEARTGVGAQHVCCAVFMVLSVCTDLSTKAAAQRQGGRYAFDPATAVAIVEACKLAVSLGLLGATALGRGPGEALELPGARDVLVLAVPGVVYTCNNILVFEAIQRVPLATFAVVRETRLVWGALIWVALFRARLGLARWAAIAGVVVGCSANQVPGAVRGGFTWGVLYAFLLAFLNASGGVVCEFAMKMKEAMDTNLQNSIIYASCSSLALLYLAVFRAGVFESAGSFFHGFEPECLQVIALQVITGLTVSRVLKHVESVTKSMVTALCSPIICLLGSAALHEGLHWNEVLACFLVILSCMAFLRLGPIQTAAKASAQDAAGPALKAKMVAS